MRLRAVVRQGRIIVDEPTSLPEGTVLELIVDDEADEMDDAERGRLHASMARAWAQYEAGEGRFADDVIARLRPTRQT
ncbi:hypothetical protein L6R52_16090 [Myxococcota bacterium]|nr:hypothetical protein [Myxococcota bacterium]